VAQTLLFIGDWDFSASVRDKEAAGQRIAIPVVSILKATVLFRECIITMLDERFNRLRATARYQGLLKTDLTDLERQFIERRLSEEQSEFELLSADIFPLEFKVQNDPARSTSQGTL